MFQQVVVVGLFAWEGDSADDLDLSALVDQDVAGVHVADLLLEVLELAACSHDVVEQVPDLGLEEVLSQPLTVGHLGLQHKLIVVIGELN